MEAARTLEQINRKVSDVVFGKKNRKRKKAPKKIAVKPSFKEATAARAVGREVHTMGVAFVAIIAGTLKGVNAGIEHGLAHTLELIRAKNGVIGEEVKGKRV